ncbi:hypothetical protein BGZ76_009049 [Entomortierella beljakovae]|nr:hypothetical protein BGZ76_009049 [Entomortierella beljakovae]
MLQRLHLDCDLEAWADILCFQDQSITISNSSTSDPHQLGRQTVKNAFQESGVALDVMVLNASKFYHLGTMQEFLEGTCTDTSFMAELNIQNQEAGIARVGRISHTVSGDESGYINPPAYIENSFITSTTSIHSHSIIVDSDLPHNVVIPENTCMFTLQIQKDEFVTFTFSVMDDMKLSTSFDIKDENVLNELMIFERVPVSVASSFECPKATGSMSLWTALVFEVASTKQDSIRLALYRLQRIRHYLEDDKGQDSCFGAIDGDSTSPTILSWTSLKVAAKKAREFKDS